MDLSNKDVREQLRQEREERWPGGMMAVMVFWVINLLFLGGAIAYSIDTVQVLSIISIVGVIGSGTLVMVKPLHVLSGAVGAICNGLALGYASHCNQDDYVQILLFLAALCNIISGTCAHEYFLQTRQLQDVFNPAIKEDDITKEQTFVVFSFVSIVMGLIHIMYYEYGYPKRESWQGPKCDTSLYSLSSIIHSIVFGFLGLFSEKDNRKTWFREANFPLIHAASIVSSFGLTYSWAWPDVVIFAIVQLYVVYVHRRPLFGL